MGQNLKTKPNNCINNHRKQKTARKSCDITYCLSLHIGYDLAMLPPEPVRKRHHNQLILATLLLILVATSSLRIVIIKNKTTMEYDEAISYLAATCNQLKFNHADFSPLPKAASAWKQYLSVEEPFCFDQIRLGLTTTDVHPPLYFWLLHLWVMAFGVHLWTGLVLNILIAVFTTTALFMLARHILQNSYEALLVTASYALNPSIILISKEARQYDLLILFLILTVWQIHILIDNKPIQSRHGILLTLVLAAGNLTHYLFFLTVPLACFIYAIWQMKNRRHLWLVLLAILGSYGLAWLFNPEFWVNINRQSERFVSPTWSEFSTRLGRTLAAFATFLYVVLPLIMLLLAGSYIAWRHRERLRSYLHSLNFQGWRILFFMVWFGGIIVGMYLTFRTPIHTMGSSKYLSMVWPFLAFLPVFLLRLTQYRRSVLLYLVIIPLVWLIIFPAQMFLTRLPSPTPQLANAKLILMDSPARGVFFPLLWHVPDETLVIAAYQEQLLAKTADWLDDLPDDTAFINLNDPPNTQEQGESLLKLLEVHGYTVDASPQKITTITTAYDVYTLYHPQDHR
ncbi:MAG: glycosyltransferase family 39 protein [Ardenticatenaceae bacterium]|nr:glycosyltransferase family 39 protein [Ardenticatenaceae bacterium]